MSVGKRVGNAVIRNRVKRRIREALRHRQARLAPGWDLLLVARPGAAGASFWQLAETIEQGLRRARALDASGLTATGEPGRAAPPGREGKTNK